MEKFKWLIRYIRHWFWKIDKPYEQKKRFTPCEGCKEDWKLIK